MPKVACFYYIVEHAIFGITNFSVNVSLNRASTVLANVSLNRASTVLAELSHWMSGS